MTASVPLDSSMLVSTRAQTLGLTAPISLVRMRVQFRRTDDRTDDEVVRVMVKVR